MRPPEDQGRMAACEFARVAAGPTRDSARHRILPRRVDRACSRAAQTVPNSAIDGNGLLARDSEQTVVWTGSYCFCEFWLDVPAGHVGWTYTPEIRVFLGAQYGCRCISTISRPSRSGSISTRRSEPAARRDHSVRPCLDAGRSLEASAILRKRNAEPLAIGGGLLVGERQELVENAATIGPEHQRHTHQRTSGHHARRACPRSSPKAWYKRAIFNTACQQSRRFLH
jgi:hypothetical protein